MNDIDVDQEDLTTVHGVVGPGVESAPYRLVPPEECESCQDDLYALIGKVEVLDYCRSCYKCCPCERCDKARNYWTLFVCPACGCRVWWTSCAPFTCICVSGCDCILCCRSDDAFDFLPGPDRNQRLASATEKLREASGIDAEPRRAPWPGRGLGMRT